ncbi:hypothetical protein BDY21DRAFT_339746 [Lineolata rhizophorae]|uniref:ADP-ribose 1''-phosphate phosphatase n=1 Tax=Lineolata rhizophorae TaxID=578093 RepID=A0A6A6P510_9PEZI|nr:hypothetical protein BDY21DRAFT_339746 [Lineolata rhizophorae]
MEANKPKRYLQLIDSKGDLFNAPDDTVIIHACNCLGIWGSGIASEFKKKYPAAYKEHFEYCKVHKENPEELRGTAQLIAPCEDSGGPCHYVGCLFTSTRYGKSKDAPVEILSATEQAMMHLLELVTKSIAEGNNISELRMCLINSGKFGVPFAETSRVLRTIEIQNENMPHKVTAMARAEEEH